MPLYPTPRIPPIPPTTRRDRRGIKPTTRPASVSDATPISWTGRQQHVIFKYTTVPRSPFLAPESHLRKPDISVIYVLRKIHSVTTPEQNARSRYLETLGKRQSLHWWQRFIRIGH